MEHLTDRALHGHPFTIAAYSIAQNPWRGGFLRLRPEVTLPAVRAIVAALEAADWTVEPSTVAAEELRVRLGGQLACPATHASSAGRWYCDLGRDHHHEHRDNETLDSWDDDTPERTGWWLPGQPLPEHAPTRV
ncbi:hypothetical protein [Streptomyces sp. NPDC059783]|uniref:hypothetical protein n=1 Tax=Streptomyces sp. NPDC059783 TaxID=3346944 RepID=UPI00364CF502